MDDRWRTSTHSGETACVEVRRTAGAVEVRDSKDRGGPVLRFTPTGWTALISATRAGTLTG